MKEMYDFLFYGFLSEQCNSFERLLNYNSFFICQEPLDYERSKALIDGKRIVHKNDLEITNCPGFKEFYKGVMDYYSDKKLTLPYERIDSFNLSNNLILSSLHLPTRAFLNSSNDAVRSFRKTFNVAVFLLETKKFRKIVMRTGPQSALATLIFELAKFYEIEVIYGFPVNYGPQRWMSSKSNLRSIDSGLRPNLDEERINNLVKEICSKIKGNIIKSNLSNIDFRLPPFKVSLFVYLRYFRNLIDVLYRLIKASIHLLINFFNPNKEYFAYTRTKYPSRNYWLYHIKDLLKVIYIYFFYSWISKKSTNQYEGKEFVLILGNYQPEKTSNPDTKTFFDIRDLCESIKVRVGDIKIVYKEHPDTFLRNRKERFPRLGCLYRSITFYKDLMDLGIEFCPLEIDTKDILNISQQCFCITSTVVLDHHVHHSEDRKSKLVPFKVFGDRWYEGLNKVICILDNGKESNSNNLTIEELLKEQLKNGFYTEDLPGAFNVADQLIPELQHL